ncbi:MAG: PAS domain-containing sensor histidine kinase [Ignavibacteriales bacterium]|nr:PAS domain-containing sensor histidine kinase [Ignavibacteriales bacterium]
MDANSTNETQFAPAYRIPRHEIENQREVFRRSPFYSEIIDAIPSLVMVLNPQRQIIFANHYLLQFLEMPDLVSLLGVRPGEAIRCIHSGETAGGCGTTEHCSACGAVRAILSSLKGIPASHEVRVLRSSDHEPLDLRISSNPFMLGDDFFSITTLLDISDEKRRRALERIFFHDVMNTVTGLGGTIDALAEATPDEITESQPVMRELMGILIDEIRAQSELLAAEQHELAVKFSIANSLEVLKDVRSFNLSHPTAVGKFIEVSAEAANCTFESDLHLLQRILGNMTKNALEASSAGQTIKLDANTDGNMVTFSVHNDTVMATDVQHQIFQRSFSTKGPHRGLGTYSIRLLTERYLGGKATFTSSERFGTTFSVTIPLSSD